jgi:hypothetical protein
MSDASDIPKGLLTCKFLKVVAPVIVCEDEPLKIIVEVPAVKSLLAFDQLPPTLCVNEPPLNVVPDPSVTFPFMFIVLPAVRDAVPAVVKFPLIVKAVAGIVLVPLPLKVKLLTVEGKPAVA